MGERLVVAFAVIVVAVAVASCGGVSSPPPSRPSSATLPSASALCPPVSEIDYYVTVSARSARSYRSSDAGASPTVTCAYGDLARVPRRSVVVSFVLFPSASTRRPAGVKVHRIHDFGNWAITFRRGHVTHVIADQGYVAVSVSADAGATDLLGLCEEELARLPISDRS